MAAAAGGFGGSGERGIMSGRLSEGAIAVSGSEWAGMHLVLLRVGGDSRALAPGPARSRGEKQARSGAWSPGGGGGCLVPGVVGPAPITPSSSTADPPQLLGYSPSQVGPADFRRRSSLILWFCHCGWRGVPERGGDTFLSVSFISPGHNARGGGRQARATSHSEYCPCPPVPAPRWLHVGS